MKKLIFILVISALFALSSCGTSQTETATANADHALISSGETKTEPAEKESHGGEEPESTSAVAQRPPFPDRAAGLQAAPPQGEPSVQLPETESHPEGGDHSPPDSSETWQQEESQTHAQPVTVPESTACRHEAVYISGAYPATCMEQGYSGDVMCAYCNKLLEPGHLTGFADHRWMEKRVHEDAYLTCYCGLVFYSAEDHDRHVNEAVSEGASPEDHGCVWTGARDYTVYTCSVCGEEINQ